MLDGSLTLDNEVENDTALVIDSNAFSRSITTKHLREFGFGKVRHVASLEDGRNMLETRRFSLVICDYDLDNEASAGLQFLEELRRENMLPYSTVFVMISSEATYAQVAEAAESALDGYLIRPSRPTHLQSASRRPGDASARWATFLKRWNEAITTLPSICA
jgi:CheY-like chemotaxis protein